MTDKQREQHEQRLIAIAMYYFRQRDAGGDIRLLDLIVSIPPELRTDLVRLVAATNHSRDDHPPDAESWSKPSEVTHQTLRELRGRK